MLIYAYNEYTHIYNIHICTCINYLRIHMLHACTRISTLAYVTPNDPCKMHLNAHIQEMIEKSKNKLGLGGP